MAPNKKPQDGVDLTIITYDSVPCPHDSINVTHTSDFVYRGNTLDLSPPPALSPTGLQSNSEAYLLSLTAGYNTTDTFPSALLNAFGISPKPSWDDVLSDAVHDDCTYGCASRDGGTRAVTLQDWVNQNLQGHHLETAFWIPLVKLLEYVNQNFMDNGNGATDKKLCYALTIRAVKLEDVNKLSTMCPCWHTEMWYPSNTDASASSSLGTEDSLIPPRYSLPIRSPIVESTIYNTVDLDNPLFQRLPGTVTPDSPTFPDLPLTPRASSRATAAASPTLSDRRHSLHVDVLRANRPHPSSATQHRHSSPPGQARFEQPRPPSTRNARSTLPDRSRFSPTSPATPSSHTLSAGNRSPSPGPSPLLSPFTRLQRLYSQFDDKPASPSGSENATSPLSGDPLIRIMAPLAGPGTLFRRDAGNTASSTMNALIAASGFPESSYGSGHQGDVVSPKQGEAITWTKGGKVNGYGPLFAAPTGVQMGGRGRIFVSIVVGTEGQVAATAGAC